eukprot:2710949-Rhodomonas_salina.1
MSVPRIALQALYMPTPLTAQRYASACQYPSSTAVPHMAYSTACQYRIWHSSPHRLYTSTACTSTTSGIALYASTGHSIGGPTFAGVGYRRTWLMCYVSTAHRKPHTLGQYLELLGAAELVGPYAKSVPDIS